MKKLAIVFYYLKYLVQSTSEHGVHSPFVFDLILKVIYNDKEYYPFKNIEVVREQLLTSNQMVNCVDMGAGSKVTAYNANIEIKKNVGHIAKYATKSVKFAQLLFRLVNYFQPENVIELGTSFGISTAYLASANSTTNVITIEGSPEIAEIANKNFKHLGLQNIQQLIGNFDSVLPSVLKKTDKVDFVFFDGNHRKQATLNYFNLCLQKAHNNSVFVFDDIYWSFEMKEAWDEIKTDSRVKVTIDLFYMGIVFFRKEQVKQHFVVRF